MGALRPRPPVKYDVRVHQSVLDWHQKESHAGPRNRFTLTLQQLQARGTATRKLVRGPGVGWSRTGLGGNGGFQWYLWWAPARTPPLAHLSLSENTIVVRAVRHHDETGLALDAGDPDDWLPLAPADLCELESPLTSEQQELVRNKGLVRSLRGAPGSGKTVALFADVVGSEPGRGLYVTYGRSLCADAREWFRVHAPSDVDVRVLSVDDLTSALVGADLPPPLSTREAARRLEAALVHFREPPGQWKDRPVELYAELHAHLLGRAATKAGLLRSKTQYLNSRKPEIGLPAAEIAESIGRFLSDEQLRELFPGPTRARAALDALSSGKPLPRDLRALDWIWIDEVQDLTVVEQELMLALREVTHSTGRTRLLVAGDEGQTIRPTDFSWGETHDLLKERAAAPEVTTLATNLRSPANIAHVVSRIGNLYRYLDKVDRPRGSPDTGADDVVPGRVVRCHYEDDEELARVSKLFGESPDAVLVSLDPDRVQGALLPAAVKGLEFRVTAVVDAGRVLHRLRTAARGLDTDPANTLLRTWLRTDIDRMRVAASRATEVLVLLDRKGDHDADATVGVLLEEQDDAFLGFSVDDLERLLEEDLGDAAGAVNALCEDARRLLEGSPREALVKARRAVSLLGAESSAASVQDPGLRIEAHRLKGMSALSSALQAQPGEARALYEEANRALHKAKAPEAARGVLAVRDLPTVPEKAPARAQELSQTLPAVQAQVPEIEHAFREAICRAVAQFAEETLPPRSSDRKGILEAVEHLADALEGLHPHLQALRRTLHRRVALAFAKEGKAREALPLLERLEEREWAVEARCQETLRQLDAAGTLFERAKDPASAVRVYREAGLIDEARRVSFDSGDDRPTLDWMHALVSTLRKGSPGPLTEAERKLLKQLLDTALSKDSAGVAA